MGAREEIENFIIQREVGAPYSKDIENKIINIINSANPPTSLLYKLLRVEIFIFYRDNLHYYSFGEKKLLSELINFFLRDEYFSDNNSCKDARKTATWFRNRYLFNPEIVISDAPLSPTEYEIFGFQNENIIASYLTNVDILNNILFFFDFNNRYDKAINNINSYDYKDWWIEVDNGNYIPVKTTTRLRENLEFIGSLYPYLQNIDYDFNEFIEEKENIGFSAKFFDTVVATFKEDSPLNFAKTVLPFIENNIRSKLPISSRLNHKLELKTLSECIIEIERTNADSTYVILWKDVLTKSTDRDSIGLNLRNEVLHSLIGPIAESDAVLLLLCYLTSLGKDVL